MASKVSPKEAQAQNHVAAMVPEAAKARVEIDEFLGDNDMTNLFLLALSEMQKEDPDKGPAKGSEDWWTFYSLSSIHGLPQELWNNVSNLNEHNNEDLIKKGGGYCTHGSIVFPTWHRVYILMFEQAVANKMREIAELYKDGEERQKYQNAAARFRLPFWDPFMPRNTIQKTPKLDETIFAVPKILREKTVFVNHWDKTKPKDMPSPLQSFSFPKETTLKAKGRTTWTEDDWTKWVRDNNNNNWKRVPRVKPNGRDHTLRTPGKDDESNYDDPGTERSEGFNLKIQRQAQNMTAKLWKLLSTYQWKKPEKGDPKWYQKSWDDEAHKNRTRSWDAFATHFINLDPQNYQEDTSISLESWHDNIHDLVGTGRSPGHMGDPAIASFDPIFWLHHCNIDRMFAIYQALYPDESDGPDTPNDPTKWVPASGDITSKTSLYPFQKNASEFWTSDDVKDWTTLGFAVPGNKKLDKLGREKLETYLRENYYWATEFDFPPESVRSSWPKKLERSYALNGEKAVVVDQPAVRFEALVESELVTRTVTVATTETPQPVDKQHTIAFVDASGNKKLYPDGSLQSGKGHKSMRTWNAQIKVKKFAFNGSFNVHVFLGHIKDSQPERFLTKKNEVGYSGIFASDRSAPCANCLQQREQGAVFQDAVPLTMAMTKYLTSYADADGPEPGLRTLPSFEPEHVVPFLKANMHWVITTTASDVIDNIAMIQDSQLEVSVWDRVFDLPTPEHRLGLYHPAELHREVTEGQAGGLGYSYA